MIDRTYIARRAVVKGLAAILPVGLVGGLHSAWASTSTMEDDMNIALNHTGLKIQSNRRCFFESLTEAEDRECLNTMMELRDLHGLSIDDQMDEISYIPCNTMRDFRVWASRKREIGPTFMSDEISRCKLFPTAALPNGKPVTVFADIRMERKPGDLVVVGRYPNFAVERFIPEDERHRTTGRRVYQVGFEL